MCEPKKWKCIAYQIVFPSLPLFSMLVWHGRFLNGWNQLNFQIGLKQIICKSSFEINRARARMERLTIWANLKAKKCVYVWQISLLNKKKLFKTEWFRFEWYRFEQMCIVPNRLVIGVCIRGTAAVKYSHNDICRCKNVCDSRWLFWQFHGNRDKNWKKKTNNFPYSV